MDKYDMRNYIEKNFNKIIEDHFMVLDQKLIYSSLNLEKILDNLEALCFYKAWKESPGFKATVFLEEIEGDGENSKDKEGTRL